MRTILGYLCYAFPFILLFLFAAIAVKEHGGIKALLSMIAIVGITLLIVYGSFYLGDYFLGI